MDVQKTLKRMTATMLSVGLCIGTLPGQMMAEGTTQEVQYEAQDLSVLDQGSQFMPEESVFKSNTYMETSPQIVNYGENRKMMVWMDSATSDVNDIRVYYSKYDGYDWSEPKILCEDGTVDYQPSIVVYDSKVYVAWQNVEEVVTTDSSLQDIAGITEINVAVYNEEDDTFAVTQLGQEDNTLDMQPVVVETEEGCRVYWITNEENDWFGLNQNNHIKYAEYNGSEWSEVLSRKEDLSTVMSLDVVRFNDEEYVTYCVDEDADMQTDADTVVYLNERVVSDENTTNSRPQLEGGNLFWYSDGKIRMYGLEEEKEFATAQNSTGILPTDVYETYENEEAVVLVYAVNEEATAKVYTISYDKEKQLWGTEVVLYQTDGNISSIAGEWNEEGVLKLYMNQTVGDQTSIVIEEMNSPVDLSVENISYEPGAIVNGNIMGISVGVKNVGIYGVDQYSVRLEKEDGTYLQETTISETLLPGQEKNLILNYMVDEEIVDTTVQAVVVAGQGEKEAEDTAETALYNNGKRFVMTYEDAGLGNLAASKNADGACVITGTVSNYGRAAQENITVNLYNAEEPDQVIATQNIESIEGKNVSNIAFTGAEIVFGQVYYVSVEGIQRDDCIANNDDYVVAWNYEKGDVNGDAKISLKITDEF